MDTQDTLAHESLDATIIGDETLVAQVLAGNDHAYRLLVERHHARCFRYAVRILGDPDTADDVVQETFVRAYRFLGRCANPSRFGAWLFQILVNRCRSALEQGARRERWFVRADMDEWAGEALSSTTESFPYADAIEHTLAELPVAQREAVVLKYVDEMTYDEMAEATGASVSALKMRVSRACDVLRAKLMARRS